MLSFGHKEEWTKGGPTQNVFVTRMQTLGPLGVQTESSAAHEVATVECWEINLQAAGATHATAFLVTWKVTTSDAG